MFADVRLSLAQAAVGFELWLGDGVSAVGVGTW
jgi:hypothetical protein